MNWPCAALQQIDLAPRTTMRVGGTAEWLLEPATPEELEAAWQASAERGLRTRLLGGGANLLVEDGEHPGVVIATERLRRVFRPVEPDAGLGNDSDPWTTEVPPIVPADRERDPRLVVWCGASLLGLVRTTQELGWSGLECLAGVPGSVGGGITMNAGGRHGAMWDVVERVRLLQGGELVDRARDECHPTYRNGGLGDACVVGAVLRFEPQHRLEVKERVRTYLADKRRTQPVTEWSSGCIFKNPDPEQSEGRSAGALVDECGGKGRQVGGAMVSPLHANFIVNTGAATAADVFALIEELQARVADRTGLALEIEVRVWRR